MAKQRYWIGSLGPYFFDDATPVNDPQGVVSDNQGGMVTEGKITAKGTPTEPDDLARKVDLDSKSLTKTTETKTVVTSVDFTNETTTTETITYVTDVTLS